MDTQEAKEQRLKERHSLDVNGETYRKIVELKKFWETLNGRTTQKMEVLERAVNTEHERVCGVFRMMNQTKKDE